MPVDPLDPIEMLGAECTLSGESYFHLESEFPYDAFSRIMWPTAVFDAGT